MKIKQVNRVKKPRSTQLRSNRATTVKPLFLRGEFGQTQAVKTKTGFTVQLTEQEKRLAIAKAHKLIEKYPQGITIPEAMSESLQIDKDRANRQLTSLYLRTVRMNVFQFIVRASGLYEAKTHQVNIKWELNSNFASMATNDILSKSKVKLECSCGRFTYWYRFIATQGFFVLGKEEPRFPVVRNVNLDGVLCKHLLKTMQTVNGKAFMLVFDKYINNLKENRRIRVTDKQKLSIGQSSARTKIK